MRLLNSISRSASLRRLIPQRKNNTCIDEFPLLKPVQESNVVLFDPRDEAFSSPNRTSSETCSEGTLSVASNGKQQESTWSPCKTTSELGAETSLATDASQSCPPPNKSISNDNNSSSASEKKKLVAAVDSSEKPEAHPPRSKSSRRSPRKTASLSRSSARADATAKMNLSQTIYQGASSTSTHDKSIVAVEILSMPTTRSLRRQPSRRFSPRKTAARPKHWTENSAAGKKSISSSSRDKETSTGKRMSSNPSIEASAKPMTCSSAEDTDDCSFPNGTAPRPAVSPMADVVASKNDSNFASAHHSASNPLTKACATPKARSRLSKSARPSRRTPASSQESSPALSLETTQLKEETSRQSFTIVSGKGQSQTPQRIATRRAFSSFEDTKTCHTTPSPVKKTPVRGLQRWNSTTSFLQSPSDSLAVLSSRQPTPFHTPATAKYSSKHKNGISLDDMLNSYHRITSSVASQSSTTVPEGDEGSCDDDSTFASFAQEEDEKPAPSPRKSESTTEATNKQESVKQQSPQAKLMKSTPKQLVQTQMALTKFMESTNADRYIESPPISVQALPSKLPFDSPPKKPQAPRGAPPAAIGRPQLHRRASTTALLKSSQPKLSTKPAKARRPGLHRQGSLMADNLQDFFGQYDNIYEKIVEDDSLAGW